MRAAPRIEAERRLEASAASGLDAGDAVGDFQDRRSVGMVDCERYGHQGGRN